MRQLHLPPPLAARLLVFQANVELRVGVDIGIIKVKNAIMLAVLTKVQPWISAPRLLRAFS